MLNLKKAIRTAQNHFPGLAAAKNDFYYFSRRYRPDARIISFEPNPIIYRELHRRFGAMPGVTLQQYGLGYQEVALRNGRFQPQQTERINAIMMTPARLRDSGG